MPRVDRRLGLALTLVALVWVWLAYTRIPDPGTEWPGPRGFPLLLGVLLAGLGVWMVVSAGPLRATRPTYAESTGSRVPDPGSRRHELAVAAGTFGVLVLYAFLLEHAGFLIATPLVIVVTMAGLLRVRRWLPILSLAGGFTLGCWVTFEALGTPLPRGSWIVW
jgi:hypothetical protein